MCVVVCLGRHLQQFKHYPPLAGVRESSVAIVDCQGHVIILNQNYWSINLYLLSSYGLLNPLKTTFISPCIPTLILKATVTRLIASPDPHFSKIYKKKYGSARARFLEKP